MTTELTLTQTIRDSGFLNSPASISSQSVGDRTFLYVTSESSRNVSVFEAFSDGTIDVVSRFDANSPSFTGTFFGTPSALATTVINGTVYVYVGGASEDSLRVLEQDVDGTLSEVQLIADDDELELNNNFGELTIASVGNTQFLIVHGLSDDGISVFQIGTDGQLTNTFNVDDSEALELGLNGAFNTDAVQVGNTTFVLATGNSDDALSVFELTASGALILRSSIADNATLELNGASGVASIVIGGTAYVYVAGNFDDGISIFELDSNGQTTNIGNIANDTTTALDGAYDVDTFTFNGTNFLVVTGRNSDGVSYFEIGNDGGLTLLDSVFDNEDTSLALNDIIEADFFEVDGQGFIAVTSRIEDAVSIFQVDADSASIDGTAATDVLVGTLSGDEINGLGGDDVLIGVDGDDTLNGEGGSDVINGGDGDDVLRGDGDQSQTASDVATIDETGQDLALTVTLPDSNDGSTIEVSGVINRQPAESSEFNIVYVIDVSGSMDDAFVGNETVGDLNDDGLSNTLLDGTIAAFQALNTSIVQSGFGDADASVVIFDSSSSIFFEGNALVGIEDALSNLTAGGSTNFEAALQTTITALNGAGEGENVVYFLSDGANNAGGDFTDEVATLTNPNGLNATINSIGLGSTADLPDLDLLDDGIANGSAIRVLTPSTLTAGLTGSPVATSEVDRLEIRVNGVLQRTLDDTEFAITPLGLRYDLVVDGLSTTAGDVIEVVLVASDSSATEVAVSLTVPNIVPDIGDDVLIGGNGDDQIEGDGGNDSLFGGNGSDGLFGGVGNDLSEGGSGNDVIIAGGGDDTLIGGGGRDTLVGGTGDDVYHIDRFDVVDESGGSATDFDSIFSRLSIDLGSDALLGTFEGAQLTGTADTGATGTNGANRLAGNVGENEINGGGGADTIFGGAGNDQLFGAGGNDNVNGGTGNDLIFGGANNDTINAGDGNDIVHGDDGRDLVSLGDGNDVFFDNDQGGAFGADTVLANGGNDTVQGGDGDDRFEGQDGNDLLLGRLGNDVLFGGNQNDTIFGGSGNDTVAGGNGADRGFLGNGNDRWFDNDQDQFGNDSVAGGNGNDWIQAGGGDDTLSGGAGADTFVLARNIDDDIITDYTVGTDQLDIDADLWNGALTQGRLNALTSVQNGDLVFEFDNGDSLTLDGVTSTAGLLGDIDLL